MKMSAKFLMQVKQTVFPTSQCSLSMVEHNEDGSWNPYVLDFGLVRGSEAKGITVTGMVIGTPGYCMKARLNGNPETYGGKRARFVA